MRPARAGGDRSAGRSRRRAPPRSARARAHRGARAGHTRGAGGVPTARPGRHRGRARARLQGARPARACPGVPVSVSGDDDCRRRPPRTGQACAGLVANDVDRAPDHLSADFDGWIAGRQGPRRGARGRPQRERRQAAGGDGEDDGQGARVTSSHRFASEWWVGADCGVGRVMSAPSQGKRSAKATVFLRALSDLFANGRHACRR